MLGDLPGESYLGRQAGCAGGCQLGCWDHRGLPEDRGAQGRERGACVPLITGAEKVTTERLLNAANEPQQWMTYNGTYSEQRYSTLTGINKDNVKTLGLAWFADYDTEPHAGRARRSPSTAPIYVSTAWSKVYAFDARTGKQLWQYNPQSKGERVAQNVCCGIVNRGIAGL